MMFEKLSSLPLPDRLGNLPLRQMQRRARLFRPQRLVIYAVLVIAAFELLKKILLFLVADVPYLGATVEAAVPWFFDLTGAIIGFSGALAEWGYQIILLFTSQETLFWASSGTLLWKGLVLYLNAFFISLVLRLLFRHGLHLWSQR